MQLGYFGCSFNYIEVMQLLPDGPYAPTPKQVIRLLSISPELEVDEDGNRHTLTRYKLKMRRSK